MVEKLFRAFMALPQVEAIALGGSRAGSAYDEKSDYDVYVYCTEQIPLEQKLPILETFCSYIEPSNSFWELEDNCRLNDGVDIDILYRTIEGLAGQIAPVVEAFQAHNGYTTCMWHNLKTCKILYDRDGRLQALKDRFDVPYPERLREEIISRNMKLLCDAMPAYFFQIQKAVGRKDPVSIHHRTAAFMESYFDVIFALNRKTHPGEKRLVELCKRDCSVLPERFEENIEALYAHLIEAPIPILENMIQALKACLSLEKL